MIKQIITMIVSSIVLIASIGAIPLLHVYGLSSKEKSVKTDVVIIRELCCHMAIGSLCSIFSLGKNEAMFYLKGRLAQDVERMNCYYE